MIEFREPNSIGPYLLDFIQAEAEPIPYNQREYPVHGVNNNVLKLVWCGLMHDTFEGVILTDRGRERLAEARIEFAAWFANDEDDQEPDATSAEALPQPAISIPTTLF